jgi:hypothetical protein
MTAAASPTVDGVVIRAVHDSGVHKLASAQRIERRAQLAAARERAGPDPQPSVEEAAASSEEVT